MTRRFTELSFVPRTERMERSNLRSSQASRESWSSGDDSITAGYPPQGGRSCSFGAEALQEPPAKVSRWWGQHLQQLDSVIGVERPLEASTRPLHLSLFLTLSSPFILFPHLPNKLSYLAPACVSPSSPPSPSSRPLLPLSSSHRSNHPLSSSVTTSLNVQEASSYAGLGSSATTRSKLYFGCFDAVLQHR